MIRFDSPVGTVTVQADELLRSVRIGATAGESLGESTALEREAARQLGEYFDGSRQGFEFPLAAGGSPVQASVWSFLDGIRFGEAVSYGHIARELGLEPGAARAVGAAVGANPILIVRPCHRVLGADGSLTGYAGGLDAKLWLLQHEGVLL